MHIGNAHLCISFHMHVAWECDNVENEAGDVVSESRLEVVEDGNH